jgi:hypothetical protein
MLCGSLSQLTFREKGEKKRIHLNLQGQRISQARNLLEAGSNYMTLHCRKHNFCLKLITASLKYGQI